MEKDFKMKDMIKRTFFLIVIIIMTSYCVKQANNDSYFVLSSLKNSNHYLRIELINKMNLLGSLAMIDTITNQSAKDCKHGWAFCNMINNQLLQLEEFSSTKKTEIFSTQTTKKILFDEQKFLINYVNGKYFTQNKILKNEINQYFYSIIESYPQKINQATEEVFIEKSKMDILTSCLHWIYLFYDINYSAYSKFHFVMQNGAIIGYFDGINWQESCEISFTDCQLITKSKKVSKNPTYNNGIIVFDSISFTDVDDSIYILGNLIYNNLHFKKIIPINEHIIINK